MGQTFVCNPASREFVELPKGSPNIARGHRVAFGFDPWSGKYKVARYFYRSYSETPQADGQGIVLEYCIGHEILTIGDGAYAWKWKATMDPPYAINARNLICFFFRTCLSTYFIKREAVYGHNLMLAKQGLTCTSAQRTNNREKTKERPTKTDGQRTSRMTITGHK